MQTFVTQKIANYLSDELKTVVKVGGVDIEFVSKIVLENVYIEDLHHDTLINAQKIKVGLNHFNLDKFQNNIINLNSILLENTRINAVQYKGESDINIQFLADYFDPPRPRDPNRKRKPLYVFCNSVILKNVDFSYRYEKDTTTNYGMNYSDIHTRNVMAEFKNFVIQADTFNAEIKSLSCIEKSGVVLKNFRAKTARVSSIFMRLNNLVFETNKSHVNAEYLNFTYKEWNDYNNFEENVYMQAKFNNSLIEMNDIAYFAPELEGWHQQLVLNGNVRGTVTDLKGKKMTIAFGEKSYFKGDFSLTGLPDFETTYIHFTAQELKTNKSDLEKIQIPPFPKNKKLELPIQFGRLGNINFKGTFNGFPNDFVAYGSCATDIGIVNTDLSYKQNKVAAYKGKIQSFGFDLGKFIAEEKLFGKVTMSIDIDGSGITERDVNADIKGKIGSFVISNYDYKNIDVNAKFSKNIFSGKLAVEDENIAFDFDGDINFTEKLPEFDFVANFKRANLTALKLIDDENKIDFSTSLLVKLKGDDVDNLTGNVSAINTTYSKNNERLFVKELNLNLEQDNLNYRLISINSSIADFTIKGNFLFQHLEDAFIKSFSKYLPVLAQNHTFTQQRPKQSFQFDVVFKDSKFASEFLLKNYIIFPGSTVNGSFDENLEDISLKAKASDFIAYDLPLKMIDVYSTSTADKLDFNANFEKVFLSDSSLLQNVNFKGAAQNNAIDFSTSWLNQSKLNNSGIVNANLQFEKLNKFNLKVNQADLIIEDSLWAINNSNIVRFDSTSIKFENFILSNNNQSIKIDGAITKNKNDKLTLLLANFDLANFNTLLRSSDLHLQGIVNGNAEFSSIYDQLIFSTGVNFQQLQVNNEMLGNGSVISIWNRQTESISLNGRFMRGTIPTIAFTGLYYPNRKEDSFDIEIQLQKTQLKLFEKYAAFMASDLKGIATGDLFLLGSPKEPILKGKLEIQKAGFKFDYVNVDYTFSNEVEFKENEIIVPRFILFDSKGNKAYCTATINHTNFKDLKYNISVEPEKLMCLNTTLAENEDYYGEAFATGNISVVGDEKNTLINVAVKTERGTSFKIPLEGAAEVSESNFITFINKDTTQLNMQKEDKIELTGIVMNLDLEVTPDAEVQLIFDPKVGDVITANGTGNIKMDISSSGEFSMIGDYVVNKGSYLFTLKNVINKKFKLAPGGTINWTGDPFNADININAIYALKASLKDISESDTSGRRVPVDINLNLTDKLMNPNLKFGIDLPRADERTKSEVKNLFSDANQDELNKQVFALLVLGRFIPMGTSTSGSANNPNAFGANSMELLSNQLNNWLSQSNDYVNLGVKGDLTQEFQLAMSKELFNDRLSLEGSFGYRDKTTSTTASSSASNLVGDVNIEYKLSKDGRYRVRAFNQSNENTIITNNAPYKQGLGFFYREDFETVAEYLQRRKTKKQARKAAKQNIVVPEKTEQDSTAYSSKVVGK